MLLRPALLSVVTIPTGGWTFKFYLSDAAAYDKTVTVTLAAGDYFISGDNQSDDLLFELQTKVQAGIIAAGGAFIHDHYFYASADEFTTTAQKYVRLAFSGFTGHPGNHIKIAWSESSVDLAAALGFPTTDYETDGTDSGTYQSGSYGHAYAWHSDDTGQLIDFPPFDAHEVAATQKRGPIDGRVKSCLMGDMFSNEVTLQWLSRAAVASGETDYGDAPPYPYDRNRGLECWWREARQGKHFRLYDHKTATVNPQEVVTRTADSATTLTDTSKAWATNRWVGCVLRAAYGTWRGVTGISQEFRIASNTSNVLTVHNAPPDGLDLWVSAETFTIYQRTYRTYVVDLERMNKFQPLLMSDTLDDYCGVTIPLFRYVAP